MENLIKIKLDPRRGGSDCIAFIRPNFIISNWPGGAAVLQFSPDGGVTWVSLIGDVHYRCCFNPACSELYVSLLFDIQTESQLAFFCVEEAAPELAGIPLGWTAEGLSCSLVPLGWVAGAEDASNVQAGYTVYGCISRVIPAGWIIKWLERINTQIGWTIAEPVDVPIPVGFDIGSAGAGSVQAGTTILGVANYPVEFIVLDKPSIDALGASAVRHREKIIILNGNDPEVLD